MQRALELADEELWKFRHRLLEALLAPRIESARLAGELVPFVEAAGKEATPGVLERGRS